MALIILPDSPLIRLPANLPPIQASFFDAIRLCVQYIDLAYRRIEESLSQITLQHDRSLALGPAAIMDAWSVIDTVHRLRALVSGLPGYKNQAASKRLFLNRTRDVEQLRNSFQHLVGDVRALTEADAPVLGTLTWLRPVDSKERRFTVWAFTPWRLRSVTPDSVVQLPSEIPTALTQIELWLENKSVNVSKLRDSVAEITAAIEKSLSAVSQGTSELCDSLASLVIEIPAAEANRAAT
jgi:hypothetical protein